MDDDGFPRHDALENLLEDDREELMLRNCAVLNKDDRKSFVWKTRNFKTIDEVTTPVIKNVAHPFNGTMLHRKIVERVGLPNPNLFLWGDETEYYYRIIHVNSIPFCTITNSIHYHPRSAYTYKQDWNYSSGWKMYYYLRNRYSIMKSQFYNNIVVATIMYVLFLAAFAIRVLLFQKTNRIKKLAFMLWPAIDALKKNFKATPSMILERLENGTSFNYNEPTYEMKLSKS